MGGVKEVNFSREDGWDWDMAKLVEITMEVGVAGGESVVGSECMAGGEWVVGGACVRGEYVREECIVGEESVRGECVVG